LSIIAGNVLLEFRAKCLRAALKSALILSFCPREIIALRVAAAYQKSPSILPEKKGERHLFARLPLLEKRTRVEKKTGANDAKIKRF